MKILFVCTGNTCRSPMAQAMAAKLLGEGYEVISAGVMAVADCEASYNAVMAMSERQIDLTGHRSQLITTKLLNEANLILTMTTSHKKAILPDAPDKTYTLGEYAGHKVSVSDPFGGTLEDYKACAEEIYGLLLSLCDKLIK